MSQDPKHLPEHLPGVVDFKPAEFRRKYGEERIPKAFHTIARSAVAAAAAEEEEAPHEQIVIVPAGDELRDDIAYGTDAINHLLALLNFPAKLRSFVDCLVGLSGDRSEWFEAFDHLVARRARTGKEDSSEAAMERWAQRQRKDLREWQQQAGFEVVQIEDSVFDHETGRNRATRYRVPVVTLAAEVVHLARGSALWSRNPGRALEEAARELLNDLPEAPPVRERLPKTLTDEEKLNRHRKTILRLLEKSRDIIRRNGGDVDEYFERLVQDERTVIEQPSTNGLTPLTEIETKAGNKFVAPYESPPIRSPDEDGLGGADTFVTRSEDDFEASGEKCAWEPEPVPAKNVTTNTKERVVTFPSPPARAPDEHDAPVLIDSEELEELLL